MCPSGGGAIAPFVAPPPAPHPQQAQLDQLRALLAALEYRQGLDPGRAGMAVTPAKVSGWTFGAPEVDAWLPERHLDAASLNEIKPETYRDVPAALTFSLLLAARRLGAGRADDDGSLQPALSAVPRSLLPAPPPGLVVWCWPVRSARECGGLYGPGLARLGLDPTRVLLVETATPAETLWAMEESIGSAAAAIVIGCLDGVALTPARRLALAAAAHRTPVLLVTAARAPAMPATFARWRIATAPSAPHLFDAVAPGEPRFRLTLERCRGVAAGAVLPSSVVEWSHVAHRFRVAAGMAHRAAEAASRA